eukprot:Awhi_evm1s11667
MYSSDRFQKEWFDGDDTHRCIMLLRDYAYDKIPCDVFYIGCQNHTFCSQPDISVQFFHRSFTHHIYHNIKYCISFYSKQSVSTISNLISTSDYTSTNTLTFFFRVVTFITPTTTTTTTLSYNNSNSSILIHDPTLFPTFTSLESKIQSYQLKDNEIKDLLNLINKYVLKLLEKRLAFIHGPSKEGGTNYVSYSTLASNY